MPTVWMYDLADFGAGRVPTDRRDFRYLGHFASTRAAKEFADMAFTAISTLSDNADTLQIMINNWPTPKNLPAAYTCQRCHADAPELFWLYAQTRGGKHLQTCANCWNEAQTAVTA